MLLKKSRITLFILKEMLFPFQRYKYFKLLVFWQLCDVTFALHQFHTVYDLVMVLMCLLYLNTFEYNLSAIQCKYK